MGGGEGRRGVVIPMDWIHVEKRMSNEFIMM